MSRRRRGLSFFEVLVALGIMSVLGLAVVGAISNSAKEVQTTSEYSLSLFLSQKVVEEVLQSVHENPYADLSLDALDGDQLGVTETVNPYFSPLEDTVDEFGRLEPLKDVQIQPEAASLHRLYREYQLTLNTENVQTPGLPAGTETVKGVGILYQWPGLKSAIRDFNLPVMVTRPNVPPDVTPLIAQDLPGMEVAMKDALYPTHPSLTAAAAAVGGNLSVIRDLGAIMVVTESAHEQNEQYEQQVEGLIQLTPEGNPPHADDAEVRVTLGKLHERMAALSWQALLYARDPASRIATSFKKQDVGGRENVDEMDIKGTLAEAAWLQSNFVYHAQEALRHYATARSLRSASSTEPFRQYALERKVIELIELVAMAKNTTDMNYLKSYLDYLLQVYTGRNRSVTAYLIEEKSRAASLPSLRAKNPVIVQRLDDAEVATGALEELEQKVEKELFTFQDAGKGKGKK